MEGKGFQSGPAPTLANSTSSCPAGSCSLTAPLFPNRNPSASDHPLQFNSKNMSYLVPYGAIPLKSMKDSGPVYLPFRDTKFCPLERRLHCSQNWAALSSSSSLFTAEISKTLKETTKVRKVTLSKTNSSGLYGVCFLHQQSMLAWKHQLSNNLSALCWWL